MVIEDKHGDAEDVSTIHAITLDEQISSVKSEMESIHAGNHPEFLRYLRNLDRIKSDKIQSADQHRQYVIKTATSVFETERRQAEDEYEAEREQLRQRLFLSTQERLRKLEDEKHQQDKLLEASQDVDMRTAMQLKLRKRQPRGDKGSSSADASAVTQLPIPIPKLPRKRDNPRTQFAVQYTLTFAEITDDLTTINKLIEDEPASLKPSWSSHPEGRGESRSNGSSSGAARQGSSQSARVDGEVEAYVQGNELFVNASSFRQGDPVKVHNRAQAGGPHAPIHATISSINPADISVKSSDGTRLRIPMSHLRRRKTTLVAL